MPPAPNAENHPYSCARPTSEKRWTSQQESPCNGAAPGPSILENAT